MLRRRLSPARTIAPLLACLALPGLKAFAEEGAGEGQIEGTPIPALIKQLKDENRGRQLRAARTLSQAKGTQIPRVIPGLIPVLHSERENDKFVAAQTLGDYGPPARQAVPDLLPLLEGTQFERNRAAAAKALGQILKDAQPDAEVEKVTQALIKAFGDNYSDVRREAVTACGMIGPAAKACIPYLDKRLTENGVSGGAWGKDECYMVREAAAYAIFRMGKLAACHIDLLIAKLHQEGQKSPIFVKAIGAIGPIQENVVPNIVDKLEVPDPAMWWTLEAYEVLGSFGPKAAPAVSLLHRYLRESKLPAKGAILILQAFKNVGPAASEALPTLERFKEIKAYHQMHQNQPATPEELAQMRECATQAIAAIKGSPSGSPAPATPQDPPAKP